MTSRYDAPAKRTLAMIAKFGADVTFPGTSGRRYDDATDTWSGEDSATIIGKAVAGDHKVDDIARLEAQGLTLVDPVTLLIAAKDLEIVPVPDMRIEWGGKPRTIRDVDTLAPDGVAILYTVVASS